jgi:hypothetical protein
MRGQQQCIAYAIIVMTRQSLLYVNVYLRSHGHVSSGHMSTCCNPWLHVPLSTKATSSLPLNSNQRKEKGKEKDIRR